MTASVQLRWREREEKRVRPGGCEQLGSQEEPPAEIAAGVASQRQPELAEWDGRRLAKYLLLALG